MKGKNFLLDVVKSSTLLLQEMVEECESELHETQEEEHESGWKGSEESGDQVEQKEIGLGSDVEGNEQQSGQSGGQYGDQTEKQVIVSSSDEDDNEMPTSQGRLLILLEIEARLRMLCHSEDSVQLLEKLISGVQEWKRMKTYRLAKMEYGFRMMLESSDSVWLLGSYMDGWDGTRGLSSLFLSESVRYMQMVEKILHRVFPTDIRTEWHPQRTLGREQLLATFRQTLKQWQEHTDSLRHQHEHLKVMLECWPEHCQVRTCRL